MAEIKLPSSPTLTGLRVVDASRDLAGQVATHLLAEAGADVVRVQPGDGSVMAELHPHGAATWDRSKTLVDLHLDAVAERRQLHPLLEHADVFVHTWSSAEATALGLGDEDLRRALPGLIIGSAPGYPPGHPDEDKGASELLVNARLGLLDEQQGFRDGPIFIRYPYASWGAAYLLTGGLLVKVLSSDRQGGGGGTVHTSLLQGALVHAALYWQRSEPSTWTDEHTLPKLDGQSFLSIFECADGRWLQLVGAFTKTEAVAEQLAKLGRDEMAGTRVTTTSRDDWVEVFKTLGSAEWLEKLGREDIACMPILEPGEVFGQEQARANGYAVEVEDEVHGTAVQVGYPISMDRPARLGLTPRPARDVESVIAGWSPREERAEAKPVELAPENSARPLAGVRVLDFGAFVAGPMASQCLADLGADVIKVEPLAGERGRDINQFAACQRGKRALALDLRHPDAAKVRERLLGQADVVVHNLRATAAKKLGLDPRTIHAVNPDAVVVSISGYGTDGPWRDLPAYDPTALAVSGAEYMLAGEGNRPAWLRNSAMDVQTGLMGFIAAVLGLLERKRSGRGVALSTSLLATAAMTSSETMLVDGQPLPLPEADQAQTGIDWWHRIYPTADGWIAVDASDGDSRGRLLSGLSVSSPVEVAARMAELDTHAVVSRLEASGVPVEIVARQAGEAFLERELGRAGGLADRLTDTRHGVIEIPAGFWNADGVVGVRAAGHLPAVGEHSREILAGLGFVLDDVDRLVLDGVVRQADDLPTSVSGDRPTIAARG
jgi:crotonobetainyl-CoA:carnitine CoA-transferase CaiB-like acyl-CoA transferase